MMKLQKKQLVLASLVLALGAAVYLNWQFSGLETVNAKTAQSETSELGVAQLVNNAYVETIGEDSTQETAGSVKSASELLADARLSRQTARDEAMEILSGILSNTDASEGEKGEATEQSAQIAQNILSETNIENLLSAKGIADSVTFINGGECNIVVGEEITEENSIVIQEIAVGQTGFSVDKIKIIGVK